MPGYNPNIFNHHLLALVFLHLAHLHVFALSSDWFIVSFASVVIDQGDSLVLFCDTQKLAIQNTKLAIQISVFCLIADDPWTPFQ